MKLQRGFLALLLAVELLLVAGWTAAANQPTLQQEQQQQLNHLPQEWATAATAGDVDKLVKLYDEDAFIHVVFTSDELHGHDQIVAYYAKHEQKPPKVTVLQVEENSIVATVGILSGKMLVEFPDQPPMRTHFSIVANWKHDRWLIHIQYTSKLAG